MTKQLLIEAVATKTGHGKGEVEAVVDAVLATIAETRCRFQPGKELTEKVGQPAPAAEPA